MIRFLCVLGMVVSVLAGLFFVQQVVLELLNTKSNILFISGALLMVGTGFGLTYIFRYLIEIYFENGPRMVVKEDGEIVKEKSKQNV